MMIRRQETIIFQSYSSMRRKDNREQRGEVTNKINVTVKLYMYYVKTKYV